MTEAHTEHSIAISVPPAAVYAHVADVSTWPVSFPPTVQAERIAGDDSDERIQIWALANGELKTWVSRRRLDASAHRVEFAQIVSQPPVASMRGTWIIEPDGEGSLVTLTHDFRAIDDDPSSLEFIDRAVDNNSKSELNALKLSAERQDGGRTVLTFADSVLIDGPAQEAYDFIYRAQEWPDRLPHVARLDMREDIPGLQLMTMDTRAPDGSIHTTTSGRVCFDGKRIVYKQTKVPPVLAAHSGEWRFEQSAEGTVMTSRHTAVIKEEAIAGLLGPDATLEQTKAKVREALGGNSMITMRAAKAHVEAQQATARKAA